MCACTLEWIKGSAHGLDGSIGVLGMGFVDVGVFGAFSSRSGVLGGFVCMSDLGTGSCTS